VLAVGYAALIGVGIAASSLIDVDTAGGIVTLNGGTIGTGAIIETTNTDGCDIFVTGGTVTNGGTLFANSAGTELVIFAGAVVNGGVALIGDGLVDIEGSSGESGKFLSNGNGGLQIADAAGQANLYSGRVSGFGGSGHSNHTQFIALPGVNSGAGITSSYVSGNAGNTSGTLFISSGGTLVAAIKMVGAYSAGDFNVTSGIFGTVAITDPGVVNGGSVEAQGQAFPQHGIDLPDIAFGAQTTLAYSENATGKGGTLTVSDGRHAASIALLGNYMAGSFVATADGHGGTLLTQAPQTGQQPLLTHPVP
jgi:hypothetical protein